MAKLAGGLNRRLRERNDARTAAAATKVAEAKDLEVATTEAEGAEKERVNTASRSSTVLGGAGGLPGANGTSAGLLDEDEEKRSVSRKTLLGI